uniref:Uncharacterized protein n=1 Tax=Clandestinovirus TaxID=2831644 RepID=A0A8F8PQU1_9VIRU|nr:hypothetical protein KOM_12_175 [Clandestinovirus]
MADHALLHYNQKLENISAVHEYLSKNTSLPGAERCYSANDVYWLWVSIHIEDYSLLANVSEDHLIKIIEELITWFNPENVDVGKFQKYIAEVSKNLNIAIRLLAKTIGTKWTLPAMVLGGLVQSNPIFADIILYHVVTKDD